MRDADLILMDQLGLGFAQRLLGLSKARQRRPDGDKYQLPMYGEVSFVQTPALSARRSYWVGEYRPGAGGRPIRLVMEVEKDGLPNIGQEATATMTRRTALQKASHAAAHINHALACHKPARQICASELVIVEIVLAPRSLIEGGYEITFVSTKHQGLVITVGFERGDPKSVRVDSAEDAGAEPLRAPAAD